MGAFPAHGLSKKRIIPGSHHHPEPVGHIVRLLFRGHQQHQRNTGRPTGGIMKPVFIFRIFSLFIHPGPQFILRQQRQFGQIISRTNVFRLYSRLIESFSVKRYLIRFFYQFTNPSVLGSHYSRKIFGNLCFHFK